VVKGSDNYMYVLFTNSWHQGHFTRPNIRQRKKHTYRTKASKCFSQVIFTYLSLLK